MSDLNPHSEAKSRHSSLISIFCNLVVECYNGTGYKDYKEQTATSMNYTHDCWELNHLINC